MGASADIHCPQVLVGQGRSPLALLGVSEDAFRLPGRQKFTRNWLLDLGKLGLVLGIALHNSDYRSPSLDQRAACRASDRSCLPELRRILSPVGQASAPHLRDYLGAKAANAG